MHISLGRYNLVAPRLTFFAIAVTLLPLSLHLLPPIPPNPDIRSNVIDLKIDFVKLGPPVVKLPRQVPNI